MHLLIADYKEELTERCRHHGVARPEVAPAAEYFIRASGLRDRKLTEKPLKNRMKSRVWSKENTLSTAVSHAARILPGEPGWHEPELERHQQAPLELSGIRFSGYCYGYPLRAIEK